MPRHTQNSKGAWTRLRFRVAVRGQVVEVDMTPAATTYRLLEGRGIMVGHFDEDLRLNQVTPGPHTDGIRRFYQHPVAMVGTDSTFVGEKPSPRTYGSYPRILGQFVRDEALLSLEEAVAKMTSMPADRLGLRTRGRLADGLAADIVVFNPLSIRSDASYDNPRELACGVEVVLVNGTPVVEGVIATGATPGRALRSGRD